MNKTIKIISIYQIIFGALGIVISFLSLGQDKLNIIGLFIFLLPLAAGILLMIKNLHKTGIFISIINNLFQSVFFIAGSVWYQFQVGLVIGFQISLFNRNMWTGSSTGLIINIGSKYRLLFNDQNTNFYFGVNFVAVIIILFLIRYSKTIKEEKNDFSDEQ